MDLFVARPPCSASSSIAELDFLRDGGTPLSFRRIKRPGIEIMNRTLRSARTGWWAIPANLETEIPASAGLVNDRQPARARPRCRINGMDKRNGHRHATSNREHD